MTMSPEGGSSRSTHCPRLGFHGLWPVTDSTVDESSIASVTNPGLACPPQGHIACLGKFEDALEGRAPPDTQATARKGHQRAAARVLPQPFPGAS